MTRTFFYASAAAETGARHATRPLWPQHVGPCYPDAMRDPETVVRQL